jgi:dCMP deaminase
MIINAGIGRVVYLEGYPDALSREMLAESAIEVTLFADLKDRQGEGRS